jgi:hypothetical protein
MCWLLCANPIVNQWLHQTVDRASRKAIALKPLLAADLLELLEEENSDDDILVGMTVIARTGARTRVRCVGRLAAPRMNTRSWRASAQLRKKPFKLFANAWCRFLLWLGGR